VKYKKTLSDLEAVAVKWWPQELAAKVAEISVVPMLLETQEKFLAVLKLAGNRPTQLLDLIEASDLPCNVFLKHLVVLSDFGGELIKRLGAEFDNIFPLNPKTKQRTMEFIFKGETVSYVFEALPVKGLSNSKLRIDGAKIAKAVSFDGLMRDMIMLLTFGSVCTASDLASLEKCDIGNYLGQPDAIDAYVKQKYLEVSRITTGAGANSLGQIAQTYVADYLRAKLDDSYSVKRNGRVILKSYDSATGMPFDVVVDRNGRIVGIEVSFQVTSNSVIERKASNAEDRKSQMGREGHYVAYVLDGAGNFSRAAALTTICQSSDCTVAYSDSELDTLIDFIKGKLDDAIR
jgi:hypothetical protein